MFPAFPLLSLNVMYALIFFMLLLTNFIAHVLTNFFSVDYCFSIFLHVALCTMFNFNKSLFLLSFVFFRRHCNLEL